MERRNVLKSPKIAADWPVDNRTIAVVNADGTLLGEHGDLDRVYALASVTKLLTAYAVLIAVEEGAVEWDTPAGPPGSTLRHLIAHTAGLAFEGDAASNFEPGSRRIYSNTGFEVLTSAVQDASGIEFAAYLAEAVFEPLGMSSTTLPGSPASGAMSTAADLARFAAELQNPQLVSTELLHEATTVVFPGLNGVLPGLGMQRPNDWGLGFELRGEKSPHWTGALNSPSTFGHFGQSGTFLWVDPVAGAACIALTDRVFGRWALKVWPELSDAVVGELAEAR
ncbi:CubicO group peptidase (beta-lactamase class C family) [Actinoalloteichus hymeniacidonis]|uniref:serine hydrolase domain-containing protein n=1 Tax=Actinoalloteichus hymeniacidonis TaxID=340345 RepID=UPI0017B996DD|nr:CubicO group peptidase (beta-lactamase class C family) [Actinoalloteichus hymeniacidonis]